MSCRFLRPEKVRSSLLPSWQSPQRAEPVAPFLAPGGFTLEQGGEAQQGITVRWLNERIPESFSRASL